MRRVKVEYYGYKPSRLWWGKELLKIFLIALAVAWLFYDKLFVAVLLLPLGIIILQADRRKYILRVKDKLRVEFKEFIIHLSGSLNAGYSLEQGIKRACDDMSHEAFMYLPKELAIIVNGIGLNRDVETLLMDMGVRCQEETIMEFARLVATAKKYGGNINTLINKTKKKLNDKLMVEKEIDTMIAAKRLEGYIMLLMPFGIVLYMRVTNGSYINLLYESVIGTVVVTLALLAILICGLMINKITKIEV